MKRRDFSVAGQRVLVVGAARSGVAAAMLLVGRGAIVTLTDTKSTIDAAEGLQKAGVKLELGGHPAEAFTRAQLIVLSPGVPVDLPELEQARAKGTPVIGELELAFRWLRGPVVAITGTKGKSTTTTLVGRMLAAAGRRVLVGGNIGVPLSAQVEASTDDTVHVVEASSFQLETSDTFHPWIAALLNFSPDHLDRHPDVRAYAAAKTRLFANQSAEDWTVVNAESPEAMALTADSAARKLRYAVPPLPDADVYADRGFIWQKTSEGEVAVAPLTSVHIAGRHMLSNVVAATAISSLAGAPPHAVVEALEGFTGLEHVMEPAGSVEGVRFVNDSKATNVDAAARSIESFDKVVAIVGGRYKGGDLSQLAAPLAAHARAVVAIGEASPLIKEAVGAAVPVVEARSFAEAVRQAWAMAQPDGVVLLAPACSSFDMFVDYADRGRRFKEEVRRLAREVRTRM